MGQEMDEGTRLPVRGKEDAASASASAEEKQRPPFGRAWRQEFMFDEGWLNLNHGSLGTYPLAIRARLGAYQDQAEARPDHFIRYTQPALLDSARAAVARFVGAPPDGVVFVGNATEGVNTILRNLHWADGDVVLTFSTAYEACGKAVDYLAEYFGDEARSFPRPLRHRRIPLAYPVEDGDVVAAFRAAAEAVARDEGRRARLALFDVVSSRPGVCFPWVDVVAACRALGVLSLVDGAQGIGMVPLDLAAADPDFFVTNCHKWLFVPRGCAILYTAARNQHLVRTSLATSHGFAPRGGGGTTAAAGKSRYVRTFDSVGTRDSGPCLCVADAIAWRAAVCGGERPILDHLWGLNKRGIRIVARALGTFHLDNKTETLTNCAMGNVALPIVVEGGDDAGAEHPDRRREGADTVVPAAHEARVLDWILGALVGDHGTFLPLFVSRRRYWVRLSAQIYLDEGDYVAAGGILRALCGRVAEGEYLR